MQKSDIKILIVDDDATIGAALKEGFSRAGFTALHVARPDEALSQVKLQAINAAIIDCMLPQMNGRDLAAKMREEAPETALYLMSGVFKDKGFVRDATQQTGAQAFFTKPFDLPEVIRTLERRFETAVDAPKAPFHDVLSRAQLSMKERLSAINNSDQMHGLDLPWIYSLLLHPRITGHLNIVTADGDVIGVAFQRGNIVQVALADTRSYFGVLLVERGFISSADLESAMQDQGSKSKRVGDRLVDMNLLSPHAIDIVIADQQGIRLSKTISNTSVKTNFIEAEELREDAQIGRTHYDDLLHEWIGSKFPTEWLRAFYMPWMRWNFAKAQDWQDNHKLFASPLLAAAPDFAKNLISGKTLEQLLSDAESDETNFYRRLHLMVMARVVAFGEPESAARDYSILRRRLAKLDETLGTQTHFERLGVSQKARPQEIKRAYHELAKVLHPDKLDPQTPSDVRELTRNCFAKVSQAYEALSGEASRDHYIRELEEGNAEKVLEAEALSEQAKSFLNKGDAGKALAIFDEAAKLAPPSVDLRLHMIWARFKQPGKDTDAASIEFAQSQLPLVPPEDRHSALFLFIRGLLLKATGDEDSARRALENAATVDPNFIPAKRELNVLKLKTQQAKNSDLLRGDLRDVVGLLFKKKK